MTAPSPAPPSTLGPRIRERRKGAGLTTDELAAFVGLSRASIVNYESGHTMPSAVALARIAESLGCSIVELTGEPPPPVDAAQLATVVEQCKAAYFAIGYLQGAMRAIREMIIAGRPFDAVSALDHFCHQSPRRHVADVASIEPATEPKGGDE